MWQRKKWKTGRVSSWLRDGRFRKYSVQNPNENQTNIASEKFAYKKIPNTPAKVCLRSE
jgi:hypothetical protein